MFLLFMLLAWMTGSCVLVDEDLSDVGEPTLTLAMSVKSNSSDHTVSTKMTSAITQDNGSFRGIEQLYIIPFRTGGRSESAPVEAGDARLGSENVSLSDPSISPSGLIPYNNARLFDFAFIPMGTNRVLAYGETQKDRVSLVSSKESKHQYGVLNADGLDNLQTADNIHFRLEPILGTRSDGEETVNEYAEASALADDVLDKLNEVMRQILLSESSAIKTIFNLISVYSKDKILPCSYPVFNWISSQIFTALNDLYSSSTRDDIIRVNECMSDYVEAFLAAGKDFPTRYGIPEGAMGFWWNGDKFVRLINGVNISLVDPEKYCYPPSLWYYSNSPVQTSNNGNVKEQYYIPDNNWGAILGNYADGPVVTSQSKAVAVTEPLQYGTALLELSFLEPGTDARVASGCPLTGIIIGDQKNVGFDFMPYLHTDEDPNPSRFIYDIFDYDGVNKDTIDKLLTLGTTTTVTSVLMLALQTPADQTIHFALEFFNYSGYLLQCQQGAILPNCKFYLAGELNPGQATEGPEDIKSVFSQDHKTTVTVRVESLKKAYNTVPDLHDPQLEIGIEAEMKWVPVTPQSITIDL